MRIKTLTRSLAVSTGLALVLMAQPARAQLVNSGSLVSAQDSAGNPGQLTISNPDATTANISILAPVVVSNWTNFNVPQNATLNIANASAAAQASLLSRVIGGNFSDMGGTVNADGVNLWLINQNGILFGSNTSINATSFLASTLDVTDADYFDFFEGTNVAGNGSSTVRFVTNPAATTFISSSPNARFTTNGLLLFVTPGLSLNGTFNAGTGAASFVAATDVSVSFSAGSPLSYTVNKGTTVATQAVAGSVTGKEAQFIFQNASTLLNGVMTIDANVATTAIATARGILLSSGTASGPKASIVANGTLNSSGKLEGTVAGDLTLNKDASASGVNLSSNTLTTKGISATNGGVAALADSINLGALSASTVVTLESVGAVTIGAVSAGGNFTVGNFITPSSVSFGGNVVAGDVFVRTSGALTAKDVSATGPVGASVTLLTGSVDAGNVAATGGIQFNAANAGNAKFASLVSTGGSVRAASGPIPSTVTVTGETRGTSVTLIGINSVTVGSVSATAGTLDLLSTNGTVSAGAVSAVGGNARLQGVGAVTAGPINSTMAIDVDSTGGGAVSLGNLNAGTSIALDTSGSLGLGSAQAGGSFKIGNSIDPSSVTANGPITASDVDIDSSGAMSLGNVTATGGNIDLDASGMIMGGALSATGVISVDTPLAVQFGSILANSDGVGAEGIAVGATAFPSSISVTGGTSGGSVRLVAGGAMSLGDVTSTAGAVDLDSLTGGISAGAVSATGGNALLTAPGAITTNSIGSSGAVDVESTGGGNLNLGNLNAGTTVAADTNLGSITGGSVTAGGAIDIGAASASRPSSVTLTGNVVGSNVNIYGRQNISVKDVAATAGDAFINAQDAGSTVTAGNVRATGFAEVRGRGNVTVASVTGDSDSNRSGGASVQSDNSDLTVSGNLRGASVDVYAGGSASIGNATASVGSALVNAATGNLTTGDIAAVQYVAAYGPGTVTTGALTGGQGVIAASSGGGAVSVGNVASDGLAEFNTSGSLTLGAVTKASALRIGQTGLLNNSSVPNAINITGNVNAGLIDIDGTGAFTAKDMTATTGFLSIDAGSISANNLRSVSNLTFSTANTGDATFDSLVSTGGVVAVTGSVPRNLTVNGVVEGRSVGLYAGNQIQVGNVTATSDSADLFTFNGGIVAGNVGATGGDVSLTSASGVTANALSATGGITASAAGYMTLGNLSAGTGIALDAAGALSFSDVTAPTAPLTIGASNQPSSINSAGVINVASLAARTTGALSLSGANMIGQINNVSAGGSLLVNNAIDTTVAGTVTGASDVTLKSGGDLTIASTGGVAGGLVALSAFGNFINDSGSDAVTASDHWLIYSNAPAGNVFGGLDSGNTALWNATLATRAPGTISGNRYAFAYQPTLTVASTDATKVYGTDLTGLLNGYYTASGLQPGVAGAYQADTLASILSGTPTITSAGAVANADVAGSPYAMNIAQGSLGVGSGYALVLTSTGKLTITPKPISASVGANDKTYDGTTAATGTVALNGTLAGDDIGTGGTVFTFSDKNVGTDKTVTVSGTMLTGADAGNYTLTVPATTLADIFAKAINASVAANSKTYDGTTAATGSVTLNGVVAGDSVGTSGTTFTFSDKNAGTGKTVTITGTVLTGADAGNYTLDIPATTLADIFARAISAAVAANSKTYDGTTAATGSVTLSGVIAGDSVGTAGTSFTFNDKNAGKNKTVSVSGTTLTGADAGNYTLTLPATTLADIFAKAITATVAANNKTYDGTTAATGTVTLNGVIAGDSVGTSGTVFTFSDKNAGTNKTVSVTGSALTGTDAGNYTVTFPTSTLASILQRALQITADDQVKFRNDPDPALTYSVGGQGLVAGDTLSGSLTRQPGEALGDYAIDQGSLSASANYTVSYAPGILSIVRDPVADAAAAGQNALRALPLPSDTAAQRGAILVVDADGLCPPEDKDCRVR